jgi:hypothetical protein
MTESHAMDESIENRTHELEKAAMTGDRQALMQLVSDYRLVRAKIEWVKNLWYRDGTIDGANAHQFFSEVEEILVGDGDDE